jgi:hypothetical protein
VRTIDIWRIDPAAARLQDVHDAADNPPIIDPRLASRISRKIRPIAIAAVTLPPRLSNSVSVIECFETDGGVN